MTFHPETLSQVAPEVQVDELISALKDFPELYAVITSPNSDAGLSCCEALENICSQVT